MNELERFRWFLEETINWHDKNQNDPDNIDQAVIIALREVSTCLEMAMDKGVDDPTTPSETARGGGVMEPGLPSAKTG